MWLWFVHSIHSANTYRRPDERRGGNLHRLRTRWQIEVKIALASATDDRRWHIAHDGMQALYEWLRVLLDHLTFCNAKKQNNNMKNKRKSASDQTLIADTATARRLSYLNFKVPLKYLRAASSSYFRYNLRVWSVYTYLIFFSFIFFHRPVEVKQTTEKQQERQEWNEWMIGLCAYVQCVNGAFARAHTLDPE